LRQEGAGFNSNRLGGSDDSLTCWRMSSMAAIGEMRCSRGMSIEQQEFEISDLKFQNESQCPLAFFQI
jgi:hypothetical protein